MKKEFKPDMNDTRLNPTATQFISEADTPRTIGVQEVTQSEDEPQRARKPRAKKNSGDIAERFTKPREKRSKRMVLLVTPTMYDQLYALSEETGLSMNELVIQSIETKLQ